MGASLARVMATATARNQRAVVILPPAATAVSHDLATAGCWWSDSPSAPAGSRSFRHYRQVLGLEHQLLGLDLRTDLHANAFLALLGTLRGGGLLLLQLPTHPGPMMQRLSRQLSSLSAWELWCHATPQELHLLGQHKAGQPAPDYHPNPEQQLVLQQLNQWTYCDDAVLTLNAPRGRGKSATLGHWLRQLPSTQQQQVFICAPSKRQLATLHQHSGDTQTTFIPPDQLLDTLHKGPLPAWLVIDEAADLPAHVLTQAVRHTRKLILATTTEGYEQAGRSFAVRLARQLPDYFSRVFTATLTQPVRWAHQDPLEQACQACFLLTTMATLPTPEPATAAPVHYHFCHASKLAEHTLGQAFQLLHLAHYQTSPNDLKLLLDDPKQHLLCQYQGQNLTGLIWLATEGPLAATLSAAVQQGKRRPPGDFIPQTLSYFLQDTTATPLRWGRIIRIAIRPADQGRGLGSRLLQHLHTRPHGFAGFGTSFGATAQLTRFWLRNGYQPVRLGDRRDAASGQHALMLLRPATPLTQQYIKHWCGLFRAWWPWQGNTRTVPPELYQQLSMLPQRRGHLPVTTAVQQARLLQQRFAAGWITWPVCRPALALLDWQAQLGTSLPANERQLLQACAWSGEPLTTLAPRFNYAGTRALTQALRQLCRQDTTSEPPSSH